MLQIGCQEPEQAEIAHPFGEQGIGKLTGVTGLADLYQIFTDAGKNSHDIRRLELGKSFLYNYFKLKAGKQFQCAAKAPDAPFRTTGHSPDFALLQGEKRHDLIGFAIIHHPEHYGFTSADLHDAKVALPIVTVNAAFPIIRLLFAAVP
jgi:hypothetical protein